MEKTGTGLAPLISLRGLGRVFASGEENVAVLSDINLDIAAGEMVAIVGASGSGKSTLMNILGCLDRPSSGSYRIAGRETSSLEPDELAELRREHFGFIFQRYHLLGELTALGNVEVPAIYAGARTAARQGRAVSLLRRLGMGERLGHRPGQLSGGQQQRVSIARALMNDAEVILADEPTGALDSHSGEEVLRILEGLHSEGRTVILVTHDMDVARRAERLIEIRDGRIVADRRVGGAGRLVVPVPRARLAGGGPWFDRFREAARMAVSSMRAHRLRSFLTMLGIVIGIAAVVNVVALGAGAQKQVLNEISGLGTNTLEIFPGADMGDMRSGRIKTLVVADIDALAREPYVGAITPTVNTSVTLRLGGQAVTAQVTGVGEGYFDAKGVTLLEGRLFDASDVAAMTQDAVIDTTTRDRLFPDGEPPLGQVILAGRAPARVVGVVKARQGFGGGENLTVYLPYTTVQARMLGDSSLAGVTLRVADNTDMALAEQAVTAFLTERHGVKDFFIINTDEIRETITNTTSTLTLLVAAIAVISLVVGGIGVMNIMLVSVAERVGEIGVRMAVGARQSDILWQFLVEAVLVCLIGGLLGVAGALAFGLAFSALGSSFQMVYSPTSIVVAVVSSSLIGIVFGFLPARRAARLDPVVALSKL